MARDAAWGLVRVGACDEHLRVELANARFSLAYGYRMMDVCGETVITDLFVRGPGRGVNLVGYEQGRIDAAACRTELAAATVVRGDETAKSVLLEWRAVQGPICRQRLTIYPDSPTVRIDYLEWFVNACDILLPEGPRKLTYAIHGAERWKRGMVYHADSYFNRYPGDVGKGNVTEVDDPGPLDYHGFFIMGLYDERTGVGYGRVVPVKDTDIVKLLWGRGFELFPQYGRTPHTPFTGYLFTVTSGREDILGTGRRIADGGCGEQWMPR